MIVTAGDQYLRTIGEANSDELLLFVWRGNRLLMKSCVLGLAAAAALILGVPSISEASAALRLAQASSMGEFAKCKREGSVEIQIGQTNFSIPRNILRAVTLSNGQMDRRWPCENTRLEARDFFIAVNRTHAGDVFYENWLTERRLPVQVEVVRRGRIKNYTSDHLKAAQQRANVSTREQSGYKVVASGPDEFFDMSSVGLRAYDGHPVVFQCTNIKLLSGGRSCRTSYPYDDALDVLYVFDDSKFPRDEWSELDRRLRRFVKELMVKN
jgi:hypothetical protein